ncbi:MarR family transcriptional regulator [Paenibacillus taichungensis]|uniref:MarR family winged helix-turn-helix transcriptional regulator n=1 Tax=Paenibacillus taichungensis TaxID=484184 RepID=UPI002DBF9527|nr:MarR family transcriptional regulator [Paenibacillus taichungensis]MEC0111185.1 MarR family transcriptional regulator [Paenibacillus taichungensis]MEC0200847.1 MarR family transcriptional regulator [Paenibacillus taichungensis]
MSNKTISYPDATEVVQLLMRASHQVHQDFEFELASSNQSVQLSGPRGRLLLTVWEAETIRMNELAIKLGLKARTITEHVDSLERDGFIKRTADPNDRRATLLRLTEEALSHVHRFKLVQEQISEKLLQKFSAKQRIELIELLALFLVGKENESH